MNTHFTRFIIRLIPIMRCNALIHFILKCAIKYLHINDDFIHKNIYHYFYSRHVYRIVPIMVIFLALIYNGRHFVTVERITIYYISMLHLPGTDINLNFVFKVVKVKKKQYRARISLRFMVNKTTITKNHGPRCCDNIEETNFLLLSA